MKLKEYRGITVDTKEFVYGHYIEFMMLTGEGNLTGRITSNSRGTISAIITYAGQVYEVNPKSVVEFTGATDKNGTRIYTGDIVTQSFYISNEGLEIQGEHRGPVKLSGSKGAVISPCITVYSEDTSSPYYKPPRKQYGVKLVQYRCIVDNSRSV